MKKYLPFIVLGILAVGILYAAMGHTYTKPPSIVLDGIIKVTEPGTVRSMELEIGTEELHLYYDFPPNRSTYIKNGRYLVKVYIEEYSN